MRILLFGGNGFIGRHITSTLEASAQIDCIVFDSVKLGSPSEIVGDVRDKNEVKRAISWIKPDYVLHLAASHYIPACNADPTSTWEINVTGTYNIVSSIQELDIETKLIFFSSAAVYSESQTPLSETAPTFPITTYGKTKLAAERIVGSLSNSRILRLFNVYGTGDSHPHIIPSIRDQIKVSTKIAIGNRNAARDFIHVSDVVSAVSLAMHGNIPLVVNIGTGRLTSVTEIIDILQNITKTQFEIEIDLARLRAQDSDAVCADISIAKAAGWLPQVSLNDGLRALLEEKATPEDSASHLVLHFACDTYTRKSAGSL